MSIILFHLNITRCKLDRLLEADNFLGTICLLGTQCIMYDVINMRNILIPLLYMLYISYIVVNLVC